ncbi:MAG: PH domain-containing protein [Spirosomataceae bacterium]
MENLEPVLFKAKFNELVKPYMLLYVAFLMLLTIVGIVLLPFWLLGIGQWWSRHYYDRLECELTEKAIRFKKGILVQIEKTIPLENIQDVTCRRPTFEIF